MLFSLLTFRNFVATRSTRVIWLKGRGVIISSLITIMLKSTCKKMLYIQLVLKGGLFFAYMHHIEETFSYVVNLLILSESFLPRRLSHCVFVRQVLRYLRICSHFELHCIRKIRTTCDLRLCMVRLLNKRFNLLARRTNLLIFNVF